MPITELTYRNTIAQCSSSNLLDDLPDLLLDLWWKDARKTSPKSELVLVTLDAEGSSFTYLFDITRARNIAAVGMPAYVKHKRDASRMAGHPLAQGPQYHRGHLMAHSIGGGADINLVPQLGSLNIGQFRVLERLVRKLAQENVRCVYFVRTLYPNASTQLPSFLEQGVVLASGTLRYALHPNT